MSVCDKAPELDLRQMLKANRTEISMAIDDLFPFLHGLVDHDIITEQIFKETLQLKEQKGSNKAVYAVLTWLLEKSNGSISEFWKNLFKDYNLERYPKLQSIYQNFSKDLELSKLRRGKKTLKVPPDQVAAKPLLKRKSPEELTENAPITHGKCASSKMTTVMPAKGRIARKTENTNIPRLPPRTGAQSTMASVRKENNHSANDPPASSAKGIFIKQVFESGISKKGIKVVGDAQTLHKPEELGGKCKSKTWKMAARYKGITLGQLIGQKNDDECAICRDGGELICCDGCPRAFHLSCLVPPLTEIPTGTWRCFSCAKKDGDTRITLSAVPEKSQQLQSTAGVQMLLQTSENETLNPRCGVCKTSGDLKDCIQCQGTFHSHCNFSPTPDNMRSGRCNSCVNGAMLNITTEAEVQQKPPATQMSLMAVDHEPEIDSFVNDHLLNKEELDSILREGSIDGILQWALQNIPRPLSDSPGLIH